ncbi:hypothetical protein BDR07DRAFT_1372669 [Suillus spraguei]|nr:hypothetical protein BDR07DRAFT_1372669 [Suillus spraguei]
MAIQVSMTKPTEAFKGFKLNLNYCTTGTTYLLPGRSGDSVLPKFYCTFAIYKDSKRSSRTCATLAALAGTCRRSKEPALDTFWKDITGFRPFISCLPSGITRKRRGKSVLRRPLSDGEWRLVNQYAVLLSAPLSAPLLPNLRSLVWDDTRERFHPLWVPTRRELLRLASLLSLKSLSFGLEDYDYEEEHYSTPIVFSKLDQVHITTEIFLLNSCLANVRFQSCRLATIDFSDFDYTKALYDPLDIPGLIVSLSKCFPPALEQLRLEFDFFTFTDERILADPSFALGFDAVASLLSFSHLTDLRLDWICISAIDDASLRTIAQSWPRLETFWFGNAARWVILPFLTFIGLVQLIHHCRHLHTIRMSFCACQVDINGEPFAPTIPNENITELSVGMSSIADPITVASQLHRFLPKWTSSTGLIMTSPHRRHLSILRKGGIG